LIHSILKKAKIKKKNKANRINEIIHPSPFAILPLPSNSENRQKTKKTSVGYVNSDSHAIKTDINLNPNPNTNNNDNNVNVSVSVSVSVSTDSKDDTNNVYIKNADMSRDDRWLLDMHRVLGELFVED
jgi:hypothetical protein